MDYAFAKGITIDYPDAPNTLNGIIKQLHGIHGRCETLAMELQQGADRVAGSQPQAAAGTGNLAPVADGIVSEMEDLARRINRSLDLIQEDSSRLNPRSRLTSHTNRGESDMDAFMEQRNELILNAWAAGLATRTICAEIDVSRSAVLGLIYRARAAGDSRAVSRDAERGGRISEGKLAGSKRSAFGPAALGTKEYMRRYNASKRLSPERIQAFLDGSAYA